MKEKRPFLAAVLAGLFGSVGFLYLGWRHAISVSVLAALMFFLLLLVAPIDGTLIIWGVGSGNIIGAVVAFFLARNRQRLLPVPNSQTEDSIASSLALFFEINGLSYIVLAALHNFAVLNWRAFALTMVAIIILEPITTRVANLMNKIFNFMRIPNLLALIARWCARDVRNDAFGEEIHSILGALKEAEQRFNDSAFEVLRVKITAALRIVPEDFTEKIRSGISPRQAVYAMMANIAGDILESGQYQMISGLPGILSSTGTSLLHIFDVSVDEMCQMGAVDSAEAKRQKFMLRRNIGVDSSFNPEAVLGKIGMDS